MLTIELNFITGVMLGFEFITKDDTDGEVSAFILDLVILRVGMFYYHDEE